MPCVPLVSGSACSERRSFEPGTVMASHHRLDDFAGLTGCDRSQREALGTAKTFAFDENRLRGSGQGCQMSGVGCIARCAQPGRAALDHVAPNLRHTCSWCAFAWAERENVEMSKATFFDDGDRILEHLIRFGREAGDDVGAEDDARPQLPHILA